MKRYVLGFAFDPTLYKVLLIEKTRPEWQAGRMNGVGGHIEEGELSYEAMRREFIEETNISANIDPAWVQYAKLHGVDKSGELWEIDIYRGIIDELGPIDSYYATTDEGVVSLVAVKCLNTCPVLPNLLYLIPMAINNINGTDKCAYFDIAEVR